MRRLGAVVVMLAAAAPALGGVLDNPANVGQERRALALLARPEMQAATRRLEDRVRADTQAATPAGAATVLRGVGALSMAVVQFAVGEDPARPALMWNGSAAHRWHGLDVPRSGYGIDNPDNIYRQSAVDGASRYEIHGRIQPPGPQQQTFILYADLPGTTSMEAEGARMVGVLRSDQMTVGPDGRFVVTIDPDPAAGRPNHIRSTPDARLLIVRDTLSDWAVQNPSALEIRRVGGPAPGPEADDATLARRAAALLDQIGPYWLEWDSRFVFSAPVNQVRSPHARGGGWGLATLSHFSLQPDEALVLTLDPLSAGYTGVQVCDPWGGGYEYVARTGSLNSRQSVANADGTLTYVVAPSDPGVHNWIDTDGQPGGMIAVRWQAVPESPPVEQVAPGAIRDVRVVRLAALREALPAGTRFVTPEQRAAQLAERARDYARRLAP